MNELTEILNDTDEGETVDAPQDQADTPTNDAKGEKQSATPAPDSDEQGKQEDSQIDYKALQEKLSELERKATGLTHALTDERQKRQFLEQRLQQPQQPNTEDNLPDPLEDPKAYRDAIRQELNGTMSREMQQMKLEISRNIAMSAHPDDYQEMEQHFAEIARTDPRLVHEMLRHPNPAEFAYTVAKQDRSRPTPEQQRQQESQRIAEEVEKRVREILGQSGQSAASDMRGVSSRDTVSEESPFEILGR
jgi:nucleotidyltransferase/DNA polymerase involved in DNA repair